MCSSSPFPCAFSYFSGTLKTLPPFSPTAAIHHRSLSWAIAVCADLSGERQPVFFGADLLAFPATLSGGRTGQPAQHDRAPHALLSPLPASAHPRAGAISREGHAPLWTSGLRQDASRARDLGGARGARAENRQWTGDDEQVRDGSACGGTRAHCHRGPRTLTQQKSCARTQPSSQMCASATQPLCNREWISHRQILEWFHAKLHEPWALRRRSFGRENARAFGAKAQELSA
eukprot:2648887-Pleurochrysis_carterae.AAC.2